ncbi:MAG TPA: hypothetical protein VHY09_11900 [Candidatus Methylacidiphilales bacterium]|jgi:hypothetical protein|nr:hypothetical protein [Candidatus Methylacidiphilales bacterium]
MKIRKQVYELTVDDFEKFPVWEFALDEEGEEGQDEATVRPSAAPLPLAPSESMFIVRAKFSLADGTRHMGYLTPGHAADDLGSIQPLIITPQGQVIFWMGVSRGDTGPLYQKLGKGAAQIFPIAFKSDVPLVGGVVFGSIPGFLHLVDLKTGRVEIVT